MSESKDTTKTPQEAAKPLTGTAVTCPYCGHKDRTVNCANGDVHTVPKAGDAYTCGVCNHASIFTDTCTLRQCVKGEGVAILLFGKTGVPK